MQKYSDRSQQKASSLAYNAELAHYKGKTKLYKTENSELREQLQTLTTQFVKVCKDKNRYKQKIIDTKEDIAKFNDLVEAKSSEKGTEIKRELRHMKRALKKKDSKIYTIEEENKQLRNQLDEQNEYVLELEARIEKLLKKEEDEDDTDHQTSKSK